MNEKMDRRVKYTIHQLKEALVLLMQEQHISKISVKALCEAADVNRSTFYSHFSSQYDLLHFIEEDVINNLRSYLQTQDYVENIAPSVQAIYNILEYAKKNSRLFMALLSENGDTSFQIELMQLSQISAPEVITMRKELDPRTIDYLFLFVVNGTVSLLHKWLKDGMIESTKDMAQLVMALINGGMADFVTG